MLNYPRANKGRFARWIPSWRLLFLLLFLFLFLGLALFVILYLKTNIPEPDDFALAETTTVYYSDEKTVMGKYADVNRTVITVDKMPKVLQHAVVSSEDRTFYTNNGISVKAIARALLNNLKGGPMQGGSTLTQQYVERYYMGTTRSVPGKVKEAVLALKIDGSQTKSAILENYLNTIYFGRGAYGIEAAANAYFGVPASKLNLAQAALLAGIIPAPSAWDPAVNEKKAQQRFQRVLRLMEEDGRITAKERAKTKFPTTIELKELNTFGGTNGYILAEVKRELIKNSGFTETELRTRGYKIITTIDKDKQEYAVAAVNELPKSRPENNRVGLISVNPTNGEIYAIYGGADYLKRQRNTATQDRAQAGSTFKLFALVGALEQGVSIYKKYDSPSNLYIPEIKAKIHNSGFNNHGKIDLTQMIKYSSNTAFITLNKEIDPKTTMDTAIKMGLDKDTPGLSDNYANVLGSTSLTAAEMARAYAVPANGGKLITPHLVSRIEDKDGAAVYISPTNAQRVISQDIANLATYALHSVFTPGGTAGRISSYTNRPFAGKTGTSSGPVSAWSVGYTPQMVTVVNMFQVGKNGEEEVLTPFGGVRTLYGANHPTTVWWNYMKQAVKDTKVEQFPDVKQLLKKQAPPEPKKVKEEVDADPNEVEVKPAETPAPVQKKTKPKPKPAVETPKPNPEKSKPKPDSPQNSICGDENGNTWVCE